MEELLNNLLATMSLIEGVCPLSHTGASLTACPVRLSGFEWCFFLDDGDLMVSFSNNIWVWGRELCKDGSVWLVLYVLRYFCGCYGYR